MADPLEELLARLRDDTNLRTSVEEATRQAAVVPILRRLGWESENLREVFPEFSVADGRVDYCLRQGEKSAVFIEVKRAGEPLEGHQEQLLGYAFHDGVQLAALTDGLVWWFYLPLREGSWEQRKFFTVDVERQDIDAAAGHFRQFLEREAVFDGTALAAAENVLRSQERSVAVERAMPKAWEQLRTGPDELLVELLADAVEALCGYRPDDEHVAQFLAGAKASPVISTDARPPEPSVASETTPLTAGRLDSYTGTTPASFSVHGERHAITTFQGLLIGVYEVMYRAHPDDFERVLALRGTKRPYFAVDPNVLRAPKAILDSGVYAETHLSASAIVRRCRSVWRLFGHDASDLQIEVQSAAPR